MAWKDEKFGLFKNKKADPRRVQRRYFVFHASDSGGRGMHLGMIYAESFEQAELWANHFFAFMKKPVMLLKSIPKE